MQQGQCLKNNIGVKFSLKLGLLKKNLLTDYNQKQEKKIH